MPHCNGYRHGTRYMFRQGFRQAGVPAPARTLVPYRLGDHVDIKANAAVHKSLPHKFYHGKTGVVWNVSPRAIGVEVNKRVGGRIMKKRIHVRVEHIKLSNLKAEIKARARRNDELKAEAKKTGVKVELKRMPGAPREATYVKGTGIIDVAPLPHMPTY
ncbi:Ribosomal protein L21e [Carpediemonas membranifera]|uniref:Ribosomal protein L21e n=1 Tax=Carpediemonas membranifera TaxID=201153 RepID=A0A8J6E1E1_9EUKA|nr:Ribosomal protein L21e [Carpediemonas membranifera]KAG9396234.1 Ribosomal protein L21e [Carpediemonas membranifera]|eukprot:KAG9394515.1 Ribosomal protein L21e [Carpediemonas membranifera]